jgi:hypothetical protein
MARIKRRGKTASGKGMAGGSENGLYRGNQGSAQGNLQYAKTEGNERASEGNPRTGTDSGRVGREMAPSQTQDSGNDGKVRRYEVKSEPQTFDLQEKLRKQA